MIANGLLPCRQIVDKTIMEADKDRDGKISFDEFTKMVENTDVSMSMTLGEFPSLSGESKQRPISPALGPLLVISRSNPGEFLLIRL